MYATLPSQTTCKFYGDGLEWTVEGVVVVVVVLSRNLFVGGLVYLTLDLASKILHLFKAKSLI